ncbi:MAG: hypothetical protein AABX65_04530 [Nanoarchaeota archaeon]
MENKKLETALKETFSISLGDFVYVGSSKMKSKNALEVISSIEKSKGILLSMSYEQDGIYKFFAIFGGSSSEETLNNWYRFQEGLNNQTQ